MVRRAGCSRCFCKHEGTCPGEDGRTDLKGCLLRKKAQQKLVAEAAQARAVAQMQENGLVMVK